MAKREKVLLTFTCVVGVIFYVFLTSPSRHQSTTTASESEVSPSAVSPSKREKNRESLIEEKIPSKTFCGYLLPVDITQQSMGALYGYTDLLTLASLLNLSSVEPYVYSSMLVGVLTVGWKVFKLDTLYDIEKIRAYFRSCYPNNDHEPSTFEMFLETASREVVLVFVLSSQDQYIQIRIRWQYK